MHCSKKKEEEEEEEANFLRYGLERCLCELVWLPSHDQTLTAN
jgi:hypothetical protein